MDKINILLPVSALMLILSILSQNASAFNLNFDPPKINRVESPPTTPSPNPSFSPAPTPTSKATPSPTAVPKSSLPTPAPSPIPTSSAAQTGTYDEKKSYILNSINSYRSSLGLSQVSTNSETCNFAKTRAEEIAVNFNHDGFTNRANNKSLPYSSYQSITENIARNSNYKNIVNSWISSPGHAANMREDTPYVCVEGSGSYWAYEGWKP